MRVLQLAAVAALAALQTGAQYHSPALPPAMRLEILEASVEKDQIVIALEPADAYGKLTVSYERKEGPAAVLYQGNQWGGRYSLGFDFTILPEGEFTGVSANWTPVRSPTLPHSPTTTPMRLNPPQATPRAPETLRDVLRNHGIETPTEGMLNMNQPVNQLAFEDSPDLFVVFYYSPGLAEPPEPLQVRALNKVSKSWSSGTFSQNIGSPLEVRHTKDRIYLIAHQSPSAVDTMVLAGSLAAVTTLHGWILLLRPDDTVFYSHSMVHFAATSPGEVWVYEPNSARNQRLYPNDPNGPVRIAYINTVRQLYAAHDEKWFAEHHHHGDPTLFDVGFHAFFASEDGASAAFIANFGSIDGDIPTPLESVLVVCARATSAGPKCREQLLDDVKRKHPTWTDPQILEDAVR